MRKTGSDRRVKGRRIAARLRPNKSQPNSLPARPTRFFGRDSELAAIREQLLTPDVRLLTLTGSPGIGKSRLALEAAAGLNQHFADGIAFVDLTPIRDSALVAHAVSQQLGLTRSIRRPIVEQLTNFLRGKRFLLMLDNVEQVVDAGLIVAELLGFCPWLKILATSREPLRVDWEREYPVPPLTVPDLSRLPDTERLTAYSAIALFVDRARAVQPRFMLDHHNARTIAEICTRLDGLPLAIEMAAPLLKVLPPQAMAERLSRGLLQLTAGAKNIPNRHQTLREAVLWSYSLLNPDEQKLFRRLAVFVGGCTLDAAEAVCAAGDGERADVISTLASLVNKSLLRQEAQLDGQPRYHMLESIREFGLEELVSATEFQSMRRRHAEYFLSLVEHAEPALITHAQIVWLNRLERDHDNLREVLRWSTSETGSREIGMRLAGVLYWFWWVRGYQAEGNQWLATLLSGTGDDVDPAVRAKACYAAGFLAFRCGDQESAHRLTKESLFLSQQLRETGWIVKASILSGKIGLMQHEYAHARALWEEALMLNGESGDRLQRADALNCLGELARMDGDLNQAEALYDEARSIWKDAGHTEMVAIVHFNIAQVAMRRGDLHGAEAGFYESARLHKEAASQCVTNCSFIGLAELAIHEGDARRAARLFGAADALSEAHREAYDPPDQAAFDSSRAMTRAALTEEEFAAAWSEGRLLTLEEAYQYAMSPLPHVVKGQRAQRRSLLTRREHEVASLVAQGLSNREIAARLFIAERTAETHVENILNKLGFHSRAQVAAWSAEHRVASSLT